MDVQLDLAVADLGQPDADRAGAAGGIGVFDRVGDRLGDDQAERHRLVARHLQLGRVDLELRRGRSSLSPIAWNNGPAQLGQEDAHVDRVQLAMRVEVPVDRGQRAHAVAGRLELGLRFRQADPARLQVQQAGDDLQVVFDPVMDFLHRQFVLLHGALQLALPPARASVERLNESASCAILVRQAGRAVRVEPAAVAPAIDALRSAAAAARR